MIPITPSSGSSSSSSSCTPKQTIPETRTAVKEPLDLSAESLEIPCNLKEAFDQEFEAELNEILFDILKQIDNSSTFERVCSGFLEQGYDLTHDEDGSLRMTRHLYVFQKTERHQALAAFMSDFLPTNAINLDSVGEQQIEFSERNIDALSDALRSGEIALKEKIIRDAIIQGEELFLNSVIETMFRNGAQLDLSQADLSRTDLRKMKLCDVSAQPTIMSGANLNLAILTGMDLRNVVLENATLINAKLEKVKFGQADLPDVHADLTRANLTGANLNFASLAGATLCGAKMAGSDLRHVNLTKTDLTGADLSGANLSRARLIESILNGTKLVGTKVVDAYLFSALDRADFSGVDLDEADR